MTLRIRLSDDSQHDVSDARTWYAERQVPGLDLRFLSELERMLEEIASHPKRYPVAHREVRKANLHRFPYAVFYHQRGEDLYVLGVVHHARHPRVWQSRK